MAFLVKALFRWNEYSKNADISVLSGFLAIFSNFFLHIENFCQVLFTCQISDQLDHSNRNYRGGGGDRICSLPAIPICKKSGLFRVNCFLQDDASAGIQSLQTSIEIKLCQNSWNGLYRHLF